MVSACASASAGRRRCSSGCGVGCRRGRGHQVEEEQSRIDLPEAATGDEHVRERGGVARLDGLEPHERLLASYQAHTFQLLEQVPALEDPVPPNVNAPVAFGFTRRGCLSRGFCVEVEIGLWLVEVP